MNETGFQIQPRSIKAHELLHVFVILFFTELKRAKFTFWKSKTSGIFLNESLLESGSGLDWPTGF